jgi:catechol 2,3-dioxygenase-like lactoylglutathione lyase family enzyme
LITGAHAVIYSKDAEADRAFLRDILGLKHVDVGGGWLIFGLPPSEVAVPPAEQNDRHELYLMSDDVRALVAALEKNGVTFEPLEEQRWGLLTQLILPSGGRIGVYQPRHARP